ncbi:MAG: ribbon-helix-helix protein, CopG family [Oscillospiraceae bacterium]|nr:ribbon-helix-helix protein, CopG family [Oscillospiraceae bacterium]
MRDELIAQLDVLAAQTNRSRNELINILLKAAIDIVEVEDA